MAIPARNLEGAADILGLVAGADGLTEMVIEDVAVSYIGEHAHPPPAMHLCHLGGLQPPPRCDETLETLETPSAICYLRH